MNPFRRVVSVTPTSPYTRYIFLNLTIVLPFLEMTDQKGPNTYLMLFHLWCEYGHTHIHHLCSDFFVTQAGMTAVMVQSNKAVLNDVKERMHDQTTEMG